MVSAYSHRVSRVPWYSGSCRAVGDFGYGALTLSGWPSQGHSPVPSRSLYAVRTPGRTRPGLGWSAFARRYSRNRCFFLFLRVLRCFSSPGSPPHAMDSRTDDCGLHSRVSPFRHPRIDGYVLLPGAFRSLSRLSSALSAKASALRPFSLDLARPAPSPALRQVKGRLLPPPLAYGVGPLHDLSCACSRRLLFFWDGRSLRPA